MDKVDAGEELARLGITLDNSEEDRKRFQALIDLMANFAIHARPDNSNIDYWKEEAEEWLVG